MLRLKLQDRSEVKHLRFDLPGRILEVYYSGDLSPIERAIRELRLQDQLLGTEETKEPGKTGDLLQRRMLIWVLGINFTFFAVEMVFGWVSRSMGLIADSLDMLADALVYGLSLSVVGASGGAKKKVARISGYLQMILALLGFSEVLRRFFSGSAAPLFEWMIGISALALLGNLVSLFLMQKAKSGEAHIQASLIFTSNDIFVNAGVILAGVLVYLLGSPWPDLIIGGLVFSLVFRGALRILKLAR